MKTYYFSARPKFLCLTAGLLGLLVASCGSYQNTSYNDNDGIYSDGQRRTSTVAQQNPSNQYQQYFGSLQKDNDVEIFTDVDNYKTADDSTAQADARGYDSGYSGWGSNADNVTVNVYGSNWGYSPWNNWYAPYYGYGYGGWGWGYTGWYGPSIAIGWGWNNWYGPGYGYYGWNNYYGNGWYNNHYHYNNYAYNHGGIRGIRNDMYGNTNRSSVGRRYTPATRSSTFTTPRRTTITNGTRNATYSTSGTRAVRNESGTRSQNYTPNRESGTRNYTPASSGSSRNYTPASSGSGRSYGGGSYGGGGRSGSSGGRR